MLSRRSFLKRCGVTVGVVALPVAGIPRLVYRKGSAVGVTTADLRDISAELVLPGEVDLLAKYPLGTRFIDSAGRHWRYVRKVGD